MQTLYTQRGIWAVALLLVLTIGCKKDTDTTPTPDPQTTVCRIQKVTFDTGEYETYTFDASGKVTEMSIFYEDANGKIPTTVVPAKLTYNAQELLDRSTYSANYEQFTYANGGLSKIEVYQGSKKVYQYEVTTNGAKQITALKGTTFDEANFPAKSANYSTTYTLDAQGRYTQYEATNADGIFERFTVLEFDPVVKSHYGAFAGMPIDVADGIIMAGNFRFLGGAHQPAGKTNRSTATITMANPLALVFLHLQGKQQQLPCTTKLHGSL